MKPMKLYHPGEDKPRGYNPSAEDIRDTIAELRGEILANGGRLAGNLKLKELRKALKEAEKKEQLDAEEK